MKCPIAVVSDGVGTLFLKVSGNFHVAAGEGVMRDGRHVHLYNMDDAEKFNSSHTINRLSFGDPFSGMRPNPLDGTSRIIDEGKGKQLVGGGEEASATPTTWVTGRVECYRYRYRW